MAGADKSYFDISPLVGLSGFANIEHDSFLLVTDPLLTIPTKDLESVKRCIDI